MNCTNIVLPPASQQAQASKMQPFISSQPVEVWCYVPVRGWVKYLVSAGTSFMEAPVWHPVQIPAVVEQPAPEGANDDDYVDPETGEVLDEQSQEFCRNAEMHAAIEAELSADVEEEADKLQEAAGFVQEDDKKYEKAEELFVDANRKFQIQKALFKDGATRAELHAAQVAYIKTVDELQAVVEEINVYRYPPLSLKKLADERWPGENHDDFEKKLKVIYDSIKSKTSRYNPKAGVARKPAAEKRAPVPGTLADMVMPHVSGANKATGAGKPSA